MVTVKGTGFIARPSTRCRFGSTESDAEVLSPGAVRCQVPPSELGGNVSVTISNNGVDFEGADRVSFWYRDRPEARTLLAVPSIGPVHGGTAITVVGSGFGNTSGLRCFFDGTSERARVLSMTAVVCTCPPSSTEGMAVLVVSEGRLLAAGVQASASAASEGRHPT